MNTKERTIRQMMPASAVRLQKLLATFEKSPSDKNFNALLNQVCVLRNIVTDPEQRAACHRMIAELLELRVAPLFDAIEKMTRLEIV
jgi:hypothetical protein